MSAGESGERGVPNDGDAASTPEASLSDAFAAAARRTALGKVTPGEAPTSAALLGAIGGVRGLVESILPGFLFLVVFTITQEVLPSVLAPLALSVVFIAVRGFPRQPVMPAVAGALGIGISAAIALTTGRAEDNFVVGLVINAVMVVVMLVSIAVKWPLIGVLAGVLTDDPGWRADAAKARVALVATILWAALPALRLLVQVPLYLAENAQGLAATKLVMGVPLYAILLWVTWLLVRSAWSASRDARSSETA